MIARVGRPQALLAIILVWFLACGVLSWATFSAVQLETVEARTNQQKDQDTLIKLAISRLDNRVAPILERESSRPYEHFRPYYAPANPLDATDLSSLERPIKLPSPLRNLPDSSGWLLLHFQVSENEGWSSPQLQGSFEHVMPASVFPAADTALAENWMAALSKAYTPTELQQKLEASFGFYRDIYGYAASKPSVQPTQELSAAEVFARGGKRIREAEHAQGVRCEPETVALENLQAGKNLLSASSSHECGQIFPTRMMPVWLELTLDGRLQLAMVRSVTMEAKDFCTLQGVLLDWEKIRAALKEEISRELPAAELVPVRSDSRIDLGLLGTMLQNLPVRLQIAQPPLAPIAPSTGMRIGLALAWLTTLLALGAITYGTLKFIGLAERKMQFVAAVTHELRTPLTSFQLYSDLLMDMPDGDGERRRKYAETLRTESKRLSRLVENVLAYSRININGPKLQLKELSAGEILESAKSICSSTCTQAGKEIVLDNRCNGRTLIKTDSEFVEQILVNLIENACKYSSAASDPRIWLSAAANPDGTITFEVDDAGPGVSPADRQAIFQPFRRSESAYTQAGGIGLGLAMSRYWAQCLGGRLTLRRSSRNGSHYTCFALSLPVEPK